LAQEEARWLRNIQLAEYLNVSAMCIWRWQRDPDMGFPQPTRINDISYTDMDQVDAWMKARVVDLADAGRKTNA
jgi:predicted DNA-binding transcriptional regulator AlpA